jgi:hypothetical protein
MGLHISANTHAIQCLKCKKTTHYIGWLSFIPRCVHTVAPWGEGGAQRRMRAFSGGTVLKESSVAHVDRVKKF